ncbi:MAG: 30S ribosomal protein S12 methylthiotransferase RimO [Syntrophomonadaceae bacterium]
MKIGFISLGCAKNRVDSEIMMGLLKRHGHSIIDRLEYADIVIINTCGFLTEAKEEAIEQILRTARLKEKGLLRHLIAAGCMSQLHAQELLNEIPELDGVLGISTYLEINQLIEKIASGERVNAVKPAPESFIEQGPRILTTPAGLAYVKISEGCNNRCSYCAIPIIRGQLRSRSLSDIVQEAQGFINQGLKELVIIGQDPASYGIDLGNDADLSELIRALDTIPGDYWIRLMYLHPARLTSGMIKTIAASEHVIPYLDLPVQHISQSILTKMNRHHSEQELRDRLQELNSAVPDLVLRTTVMVGFPGESDNDFQSLCDFVKEYEFDWLGAFAFSPQENTVAMHMDDQVPDEVKAARLDKIKSIQHRITREKNRARLGRTEKILISSRSSANLYLGRGYFQAPEVDGITMIKSDQPLHKGDFVQAHLVGVRNYDMIGELCHEPSQ